MIVVRTKATVPKTALAGVAFAISFARFMASMATFSEETVLSSRWTPASMVETRGSGEKTVWNSGWAEGPQQV